MDTDFLTRIVRDETHPFAGCAERALREMYGWGMGEWSYAPARVFAVGKIRQPINDPASIIRSLHSTYSCSLAGGRRSS